MKSSFKRDTKETKISVTLDIDGSGSNEVATGIELLDEILVVLAKASGFDLTVKAKGDLATGDHHTAEDVGIALGSVLGKLIQERNRQLPGAFWRVPGSCSSSFRRAWILRRLRIP